MRFTALYFAMKEFPNLQAIKELKQTNIENVSVMEFFEDFLFYWLLKNMEQLRKIENVYEDILEQKIEAIKNENVKMLLEEMLYVEKHLNENNITNLNYIISSLVLTVCFLHKNKIRKAETLLTKVESMLLMKELESEIPQYFLKI